MSESLGETTKHHGGGIIFTLTWAVPLMLICYPLSFPPLEKLCCFGDYPKIAAVLGPPLGVIYNPLINYLGHHPYSQLDKFLLWYGTEVWKLPIVRN